MINIQQLSISFSITVITDGENIPPFNVAVENHCATNSVHCILLMFPKAVLFPLWDEHLIAKQETCIFLLALQMIYFFFLLENCVLMITK